MLYAGMVPAGEYLQLSNFTDHIIQDLYFTFEDAPITKVRKIKAHGDENFMIFTANLKKDYDLIFYFGEDENRKIIFPNAVKKMKQEKTWSYFFGKIIEQEGVLTIIEDEEAKAAYFSKYE